MKTSVLLTMLVMTVLMYTAYANPSGERLRLCKPLLEGTQTLDIKPTFAPVRVLLTRVVGRLVQGYVAPGSIYGCWYVNDDCKVYDATGEYCYTGLLGHCGTGWTACHDEGTLYCEQRFYPTNEICNGKDDDCDGTIDEDCENPDEECVPNIACSTGLSGTCANGITICVNNVESCVPTGATTEICDGLDNDCDGQIDEGLDCNEETCTAGVACNTGLGGTCAAGLTVCTNNVESCAPTGATTEVCDGVDNDCDGQIDEGLNCQTCTAGVACSTGLGGSCQAGITVCVGGQPICVPTGATTEVCDGVDNDCDGQIDEGELFPFPTAPPCDTGCSQPCRNGSMRCVNGQGVCAPLNPTCGPTGMFFCDVQGFPGMSQP